VEVKIGIQSIPRELVLDTPSSPDELERSLLMAPDRIERMARKQLGLVAPHPEDVRLVTVTDGRIDEVGGPIAGREPSERRRSVHGFAAASVGTLPLPAPRERTP